MLKAQKSHIFFVVMGLSLVVSTSSVKADTPSPQPQNPYQELSAKTHPYDQLYPLYAVECSGTKYDKIGEAPGGSFGHSLVFLKDVCRDTSVNYPKIRRCAPGEKDLSTPLGGTTLSLDKNFINTRYIATDGFEMMMNGNLSDSDPLDVSQQNATVDAVVSSGAARGVIMNKKTTAAKPEQMSDEEWVARNLVSSSFALRFGRNLRCVSIPVNGAMLDAAIDWVNTQNEPFVSREKDYNWGTTDECAHFAHNILASMGIGNFAKTSENLFYQIFAFSSIVWKPWNPILQIPMNEVLSSEERTGESNIETAEEVYANADQLSRFKKYGRLASTEGVLMWAANAHTYENSLFHTGAKPTFLDIPLLQPRAKKLERVLSTPSKTELDANLTAYRERLEATIQSEKPIDQLVLSRLDLSRNEEFKEFYSQYVSYLKDLDAAIVQKQGQLKSEDAITASVNN